MTSESNHPSEIFFNTVVRHFITLTCNRKTLTDSQINNIFISCFVISIDENWFLITAG